MTNIFSTVQAIVLAGGRGTRMKAVEKNKVMCEVGGKPMISYSVSALKELGIEKPIVVVGFSKESIQEYLKNTVEYAIQAEAKGTADAVRSAMSQIKPDTKNVFVLYGDHTTFYTAKILRQLFDHHVASGAGMTLITTHTEPAGYGRVLRDANGAMIGVVEEKIATEEQKKIREINTGNAVYTVDFLKKYLPKIEMNPISGEYYFTDIIELGFRGHEKIETFVVEDELVAVGINTPDQLQNAEQLMKGVKRNEE